MTQEELSFVTCTDDEALSAIDLLLSSLFGAALISREPEKKMQIGQDMLSILGGTLNRWESEMK